MLRLKDRGKTVIAITHRIGAALAADKVVLLDKGKLITEGAHAQLIKYNGKYKEFWKDTLSAHIVAGS